MCVCVIKKLIIKRDSKFMTQIFMSWSSVEQEFNIIIQWTIVLYISSPKDCQRETLSREILSIIIIIIIIQIYSDIGHIFVLRAWFYGIKTLNFNPALNDP